MKIRITKNYIKAYGEHEKQEKYKPLNYYENIMKYVKGDILTADGFEKGYLGFKGKTIVESGNGSSPKKPVAEGIIVPSFVNAHTHIGDSFIRNKHLDLPRNVEELVAPPDGLKHRLLQTASHKEIVNGMNESIHIMRECGTSGFWDFRENGIKGIMQLNEAMKNEPISSFIFSRPKTQEYNKEEISQLLENSEGIGISSISDWDYSELTKIAREVKRKKKLFALHASEAVRENIDNILDLKPDFLVHLVKATESDLICVKEQNIPVVVCPRSNIFFGLKPNLALMKKVGLTLLLGTDNAMLHAPCILDELRFVQTISHDFTITELLRMITYTPRKALNQDSDILVPNSSSSFVVLDTKSLEPIYRQMEEG